MKESKQFKKDEVMPNSVIHMHILTNIQFMIYS